MVVSQENPDATERELLDRSLEVRTLVAELNRRREQPTIRVDRKRVYSTCELRLNRLSRLEGVPDSPELVLLDCEEAASVAMAREEATEAVEVPVGEAAVGSSAQGAIVQLEADRYPVDVAFAGDVAVIAHTHTNTQTAEGRVSVVNASDGKLLRECLLDTKHAANNMAVHEDTIYVSSRQSKTAGGSIVKFGLSTGLPRGSIGSQGSGPGQVRVPMGLAISGGELYVAETGNHRVQVFGLDGSFVRTWGVRGSGPGQFKSPVFLAVHGAQVYVADYGNHRVQVFGLDGSFVREWGGRGSGEGQFDCPVGIMVRGELVYVADFRNHRVQVFGPDGSFVHAWGTRGSGPSLFTRPRGLAVHAGHLWVCDVANHRVLRFR